jgi:RimJ/RimL family protein N-acetyltransferase
VIRLRKSEAVELQVFVEMELQSHARNFINSEDLETHQKNFADRNIIYLSIDNSDGRLAGYFILASNPDDHLVEFRRVLIDQDHRGIGQSAITAMASYCRDELGFDRIWLDVYEDNAKGRHIYEKLGYKRFKEGSYQGRKILYYHKDLR